MDTLRKRSANFHEFVNLIAETWKTGPVHCFANFPVFVNLIAETWENMEDRTSRPLNSIH